MLGDSKKTQSFVLKKRFFVPVLVLSALLAAMVGTRAWLQSSRSLQTVTPINMTELSLKGPDDNSIAIDLNSINVSQEGSAKYAFSVEIKNASRYKVQLGYTTNLGLNFTLYPAYKEKKDGYTPEKVGENFFYYDAGTKLSGNFLGTDGKLHEKTYEGFSRVQSMAEPIYWQSVSIPVPGNVGTDYYIMEISWNGASMDEKETDMIYLTVGIDTALSGNTSQGKAEGGAS